MSRRAAVLLRLVVGIGALAYLVSVIDLRRARDTLAAVAPIWLGAAFVAQLGAKGCWLVRWGTLLRSTGHSRSPGELLRLILVGLFFNNFLPTSVGGDVARGLGLALRGVPRATAAASVVADRVIGLLALALMAVVGGLVGRILWPGGGPWEAAGLFALAGAGLLVGVTRPQALGRLARFGGLPEGISRRLRRLLEALALLTGRGRVIATALAVSLGLAACSALFHWSVGRALGIEVPLLAFLVIVPTVMLFAALPITLNGLGVRELGFVAFLGAQGTPQPEAAAFAFLASALPLVFALAGGLLFLTGADRRRLREGIT